MPSSSITIGYEEESMVLPFHLFMCFWELALGKIKQIGIKFFEAPEKRLDVLGEFIPRKS